MKICEKLILVLIINILFACGYIYGQEFNIGLAAGVGNNHFIFEKSPIDSGDVQRISGFNFAFTMEYFQYEHVAFQTGLRLNATGGKYVYKSNSLFEKIYAPAYTETRLLYLYIPLSIVARTRTNPGLLAKFSLEGGILLDGYSKHQYPDGKTIEENPPRDIAKAIYNGLIGSGITYQVEEYLFVFEVDWQRNLTGIYKDDKDNQTFASGILFNLAIMVDISSHFFIF